LAVWVVTLSTVGLGSDKAGAARGIGCGLDELDRHCTRGVAVTVALPDAEHRWRCGGCGNLTRFDVTRTRKTTEYWHFDLAGEPAVEETELRSEVVEQVSCRWCGRDDAIELVDRSEAGSDQNA